LEERQQALAELRKQLQQAQAQQRLTKTQLARRTRLGRTTISQAFSDNQGPPSPATVSALAKVLRLDTGPLLELLRQAIADPLSATSGSLAESPVIVTSRVVARPELTKWGLLGSMVIEVLVEARGMQAVVLHGIRPIVLRRQPVWHDWCLTAMHVRGFRVDLDTDPPTVRPESKGSDLPEVDFPFTVSSADPEMFRLAIKAHDRVDFELELSWTCTGRIGCTAIKSFEGGPFTHP
jgi:transcriptional regulator with XRE-family HTH domain